MNKIASVLLIPIVALLFYNQVANWHFHKLPSGYIVEHAHPYSKSQKSDSNFPKHSHTELELIVLAILYTTVSLLVLVIPFAFAGQFIVKEVVTQYSFCLHKSSNRLADSLRGPPIN